MVLNILTWGCLDFSSVGFLSLGVGSYGECDCPSSCGMCGDVRLTLEIKVGQVWSGVANGSAFRPAWWGESRSLFRIKFSPV